MEPSAAVIKHFVGKLRRTDSPWELIIIWHEDTPKRIRDMPRIRKLFHSRMKYLEKKTQTEEDVKTYLS